MSGIPSGAIIHVGGRTVLNRLQNVGLQDPKVPTQTIYETGNNLAVGKVLQEADFRFQMQSLDVSTDMMGLFTGSVATGLGVGVADADPAGTVYKWENLVPINVTSPWKSNTGSQGGNIAAGVIIPNLYATALSYRLGVTENAEMQATLSSGSYFMSEAMPLEEYALGDGATTAFASAHHARVYRIGGAGSTNYAHVFGVMVNGVQQIPGIDYTESGGANPEAGGGDTAVTINFAVAPPAAAVVKYCYMSDTAAAIPQADNLPASPTKPAAVRGRDITILIGDPQGTPLKLYGVQSYEQQSSVSGQLQRQMGTQDPIGFANTGIDTTGTITVEPASTGKLFEFLSSVMGVDRSEIFGYINQYVFPLTAVIHEPGTQNIIKSIFVPDAFFQAPGENARVQTVTQFPLAFESTTGSFHEVKGQLPTVGE